jgi:hypothetical protein
VKSQQHRLTCIAEILRRSTPQNDGFAEWWGAELSELHPRILF